MKYLVRAVGLIAITSMLSLSAHSNENARGTVLEHLGDKDELIVSRSGVVYQLSGGDDLFEGDILRSQVADSAIVSYDGCVYTLPEKQDIKLDDDFCLAVANQNVSMALIASENSGSIGVGTASAPLAIGGAVLSGGGILAAIDGGASGTESTSSGEAGAEQSFASSP